MESFTGCRKGVMTNASSTSREKRTAAVPPGARIGDGLLQWNRTGWFGAQLGGTLWLGLCGALLATYAPVAGLSTVGLCLAANAIGFGLWKCRAHLAPYLAIQLLCLVSFSAAAISFGIFYRIGLAAAIAEEEGGGLPLPLWVYLGIYPALMILFRYLDRSRKSLDT